ncbi:MAG: tRNA (adenosine(37)-N6)-threonylcarbamoyltransferase complex ATPase subunit type 1 TsaE [Treponema sp.]|jgi:tRNA threonylcarbamoyladenosine biosynthesis protein TsaE|nr:tRNA (adenosine(37)-N6)-threonylcarbamoyltransferase complex ATPase subunit type 1 TsaE [Treponema sp.]
MKTVDYPPEQISSSARETILLGEEFGKSLAAGNVVALSGGLGAGKTCFTKGIAAALGITEEVTSPTYTIVCEYEGFIPLRHIDAYRLSGEEDFCLMGGEELVSGNCVVVVEWPEKIAGLLPENTIFVDIEICGEKKTLRRIRKTGCEHTGL